jgi:uncharacterized protein YifE (UPF0438 family)
MWMVVGFALNVNNERKFYCAIMKQVQRSDAGIEVDKMHTRWMNALSKRRRCITVQGLVKYAQRGEEYRD